VAAADDGLPGPSAIPPPAQDGSSDNSTSTPNGDQLYTIQENRTLTNDNQTPNGTPDGVHPHPNLVMTPHGNSDNALPIAAIAIVIILAVVVGGAIGVFYFRKKAANTEN